MKNKESKKEFDQDSVVEEATEEMRRAIALKAVEAFMEAAPQFFLQIYITYKRKQEDAGWCKYFKPYFSCIEI